MSSLRTKGKSTVVWILMGMLLVGLAGFGAHNFSNDGAVNKIGTVGKTPITTAEYLRGIRSSMQNYTAQTGQNLTAEQARTMGLTQQVQGQLFTAAALSEGARTIGLSVGDGAVAKQVMAIPAFKTPSGTFDRNAYDQIIRQQGMTIADFETEIRRDETRALLQRAITGGVAAPSGMANRYAAWILETRNFGWQELTAADLPQPVTAPDDATLQAWYQANAAKFTAPETKQITYAWVTPEMLAATAPLDQAALRDLYQQNINEYQQPERRMVERLIFPDDASAAEAKARIDSGAATFSQVVTERGLDLTSIDLGEMTQAQLGTAGEAVFALEQPGVTGPVQTDLGPALFSMNAILDPVNVSFDQAEPDLRAEAAENAGRRQIEREQSEWEDMLAGGTPLEELPGPTPFKVASIDWYPGLAGEPGSITGYSAFRDRAASLAANDFAQLFALEDGGVFSLRLDKTIAPALRPFEEVRDQVLADWTQSETRTRLEALADERKLALTNGTPAPAPAAPAPGAAPDAPATPAAAAPATLAEATDIGRDGDGNLPLGVVSAVFGQKDVGAVEKVVTGDRVFLVRLDAVNAADLAGPDAQGILATLNERLSDALQSDIVDYYARGVQATRGVTVNTTALTAANGQIQ